MKWEHELMRDMLERAREYKDVQTFECMNTAAMLKQAATVMNQWHRKMMFFEMMLERISNFSCSNEEIAAQRMRHIAKNALETVDLE